MSFKKQRKLQGIHKHYSLSKKLRREDRSSDDFEVMLSQLSLEEVIGLKLELATKTLNGRQFGLPVWRSLHPIVKDAVLKWIFSASRTQASAASYLGLNMAEYKKIIKKYGTKGYFSEESVDKTE
jgi:DNA-binding protein Fis